VERAMSVLSPLAPLVLAIALSQAPGGNPADDRLYGRIVTASGDVFEGFIRWDKNEGSWDDLLNGTKEIPSENAREAARLRSGESDHSVNILGLRISWPFDVHPTSGTSAESGIRFGHVRSITVLDDDRALLLLRNGQEIELSQGSTDIGTDVRGIEVEDARHGVTTLEWEDVDVVEFMAAPAGVNPGAPRLYGTMEDRFGNTYTGWVSWDLDEILATDVLNGQDRRGRRREIRFGDVASIERAGSSAARVTLRNGEELLLDDSNDVDGSNRGIQLSDPELGQIQVDWDAFEALRFQPAPAADRYDRFDGGHRLHGTVVTDGGDRIAGEIRWDNDEEFSWEILDGRYHGIVYDVELGQVRHLRREGRRGSTVTLRDGRVLDMEESNDVSADNKGVYVTRAGGETVLVSWEDFREVTFDDR
jgi:hypothetical protein